MYLPQKDKSSDLSSSEDPFSLKRRSIRSATEGGTLSMNCSSIDAYKNQCLNPPKENLQPSPQTKILFNTQIYIPSLIRLLLPLDLTNYS